MYAIIRAGGKQAKVSEGDLLDVERIKSDGEVSFTPLLIVEQDGTVISDRKELAKAKVTAEILGESSGPKVDIFKYKAKTGYRRRQGHRQTYTQLRIKKIQKPGAKASTTKKAAAATTDEKQPAAATATTKASTAKKPATKKPTTAKKSSTTKKPAAKKPAAKKPATKKDS